jgi:hypothetical protein
LIVGIVRLHLVCGRARKSLRGFPRAKRNRAIRLAEKRSFVTEDRAAATASRSCVSMV